MDTEDLTTKDMKVILHKEEHWACLPSADAAHCTWGTTSCPSTEPAWSTARWRKPPSSWPTPQTRSSWRSFPIIRPAWLWRDLTMVRGSVWISLCIFALRLLLASSSRVRQILNFSFPFKTMDYLCLLVFLLQIFFATWHGIYSKTPNWGKKHCSRMFWRIFRLVIFAILKKGLWCKLSVERREVIWHPVILNFHSVWRIMKSNSKTLIFKIVIKWVWIADSSDIWRGGHSCMSSWFFVCFVCLPE